MHRKTIALLGALFAALLVAACQPDGVGDKGSALVGGQSGGPSAVGLILDLTDAVPTLRCTGTLIAPDVVLTAAHCILDDLPQSLGFARSHTLSAVGSADILVASDLHPHPLFVGLESAPLGVGQANDIGVMILSEASSATPYPVAGSGSSLATDDTLTLVGAGWIFAGGSADGEMNQGTASLTELGDFELAAGNLGEAQACPGDSGGAVIAEGRLVGVISRSGDALDPCAGGTVATLTQSYLDFIELYASLPCGSGDEPACGATDSSSTTPDDASAARDSSSSSNGGNNGGTIVPRDDSGGCSVSGRAPAPLLFGLALLLLWRRRRATR